MRVIFLVFMFVSAIASAQSPLSIAFYYSDVDSVRELTNFDRVVLAPDLISSKQIQTLHKADTEVFAYLSVGEYDGQTLPAELIAAAATRNRNWNSHVMDLSSPAWKQYLTEKAGAYMVKGFDGLFLDTLDSYYLFSETPTDINNQRLALIDIINDLSGSDTNSKIILNRGFEIIERLNAPITAVVAESLYNSYHPVDGSYRKVTPTDSKWLIGQLDNIKKLGIEAIVIDYIPARDREAQKNAAKRLIKEGYTPYISDGMLYEFGVSTIIPVAKRVLGFYDSQLTHFRNSPCHQLLAMPLEYYGYVPECRDIHTTDFSSIDLSRYAAITLWLPDISYKTKTSLQSWLAEAIDTRPILFLGSLPPNKTLRQKLGIIETGLVTEDIKITSGSQWLQSQSLPYFSEFETQKKWESIKVTTQTLIEATDREGNSSGLLFKAPWGGAVLMPLPVANLPNGSQKWLIDPFHLLDETLNLPEIPAADVTTESGLRILTSHVDGDGFPSKAWFPGKPYTAEVLLEHVFKKHNLPQTVSVIEGEVGKRGLYPEKSNELEAIARKIFSLPHIEIASHTFSHPFYWDQAKDGTNKRYGDYLTIPGYILDYRNEILGSTDYINRQLAPEGKKVQLILWSGDADPTEDILGIAEEANLLNVNGGNTFVVKGQDSLTKVSPTIAWFPAGVHVYAPVLNENLYTNLWTEHFDGYNRAIETFELLGAPRRLKSVSIYYHMYSGTYPSSLKSLLTIYDWALKQQFTPLFLSEYAKRARALYETGLAKTLEGKWQITSTGIRSIRLPSSLGIPVMKKSNIAGWNSSNDGRYLILNTSKSIITLGKSTDHSVRLKSANGKLLQWQHNDNAIKWAISSHVPLIFELANVSECNITSNKPLSRTVTDKKNIRYSAEAPGHFTGTIHCETFSRLNSNE